MRKKVGIIKRVFCISLVFLLSINNFAAVVSDNDGAAFITKAEFDALKNDFQSQIDSYNNSIDSKIDGAIASYLAGIQLQHEVEQDSILNSLNQIYGKMKMRNKWQPSMTEEQKIDLSINATFMMGIWYNTDLGRIDDWGDQIIDHGSACHGWQLIHQDRGGGSAYKINQDKFGNYVEDYYDEYYLKTIINLITVTGQPSGDYFDDRDAVFFEPSYYNLNDAYDCSLRTLPNQFYEDWRPGWDSDETGNISILNVCKCSGGDDGFNKFGYLSCANAHRFCQMAEGWANEQWMTEEAEQIDFDTHNLFDSSSWFRYTDDYDGWQVECCLDLHAFTVYHRTMEVFDFDLATFHNKYCSDAAKERVPLFGGFPLVRCTEDGKLVLKIKLHSSTSNNISAIVQKGTFGNVAPTSSTPGIINGIANGAEIELTFPNAKKEDVYYIKMWDANSGKEDIWAETTQITIQTS